MKSEYDFNVHDLESMWSAHKGNLPQEIGVLYTTIFREFQPGEEHDSNEVIHRLDEDLKTGNISRLVTMERGNEVVGFLWAWMGLPKDQFIEHVAESATLAIKDEMLREAIRNEVTNNLRQLDPDTDWEHIAYVPETGIAQNHRGGYYFYDMIARIAEPMVKSGNTKFLLWTIKSGENARMYNLMVKKLHGEVIADLPDDRVLVMGDSRLMYQMFVAKEQHEIAN